MLSFSGFDENSYASGIEYVSRLSRLYSSSEHAYIVYRFIEKLFCITTGAEDLASMQKSFDARKGVQGFGVKTFTATSRQSHKREKIAEFTRDASSGAFQNLTPRQVALQVAQKRNARIASDAIEIGVDIAQSYYHCLIRFPGFAVVHEEPYELIDVAKIFPTAQNGQEIDKFPSKQGGTVYFSDGKNFYQFSMAKHTLLKAFSPESFFVSKDLKTPVDDAIWSSFLRAPLSLAESQSSTEEYDLEGEYMEDDYVILPLYSTQGKTKQVAEASGINQWNAEGRPRKFGEAYIPVPKAVHKLRPNFFPPRHVKFVLVLPTGARIAAKICQSDDKALMSDPNDALCKWLFSMIDGSLSVAEKRLTQRAPYTYADLQRIDKDSVRISLNKTTGEYHLTSMPLGAYDTFVGA